MSAREPILLTMEQEERIRAQGYSAVCGVDEAGRGPLAGPVVAAAVILAPGTQLLGVTDSKKISEKKREQLFDYVCENALAYGIGEASETEIDGNRIQGLTIPTECVVGGDAKVLSIAAASILAKVARDRKMRELAEQYPQYGFEKHKGYGTKAHYAAIAQYGICPIHRRTFLKKVLSQ